MFKWPDDTQSPGTWHAQVAAAAVATEQWQGGDDPWRFWPQEERAAAAEALLRLRPATLDGLLTYSQLMGARSHQPNASGELEQARQDLVAGALLEVRRNKRDYPEWLVKVSDASRSYVGLQARVIKSKPGPAPGVADIEPPEPWTASALSLAMDDRPTVVFGELDLAQAHLVDELEYRCLRSADDKPGRESGQVRPVLPVRTDARYLIGKAAGPPGRLAEFMSERDLARPALLLGVGAVQLLISRFEEVSAEDRAALAAWLESFRQEYPGTRITVCCQGKEAPAELGGWRAVALTGPSPDQIGAFLGSRVPMDAAKDLTSAIFDPAADPDFAELAHDPLLISLLAETWSNESRPSTVGDLIDARMLSRLAGGQAGPAEWIRYAESLAESLTESGPAAAGEPPAGVPAELAELGILDDEGQVVRFRAQIYQNYFAARSLRTLLAAPEGTDRARAELRVAGRFSDLCLVQRHRRRGPQ